MHHIRSPGSGTPARGSRTVAPARQRGHCLGYEITAPYWASAAAAGALTFGKVFCPGSHIRVRRRARFVRLAYWHHGLYVAASEVIEFGGGDLLHKGQTQVRRVRLTDFAKGGSAESVPHPITWSRLTYSPPLPSEQVVDRAEWLLHNQPPRYRLGYRNCESIAIWCATGDFESFQVKAFIRWRALFSLPIIFLLTKRPAIGFPIALVGIATTALTAFPYNLNRAFFNHARKYPGIGNWTAE